MYCAFTSHAYKWHILSLFFIGVIVTTVSAVSTCGGEEPCHCGDTLIADRTLSSQDQLTQCNGIGLRLPVNNVTLQCDRHRIGGTAGATTGLAITGDNITIRECTINRFHCNICTYSSHNTHPTPNIDLE